MQNEGEYAGGAGASVDATKITGSRTVAPIQSRSDTHAAASQSEAEVELSATTQLFLADEKEQHLAAADEPEQDGLHVQDSSTDLWHGGTDDGQQMAFGTPTPIDGVGTPATTSYTQMANLFSRKSSQGIVTGPRSCTFCSRTFVSQHALDIHLSRNQECRAAYRRSVTAARNSGVSPPSVSRDPVPPVERPDRDLPAAVTAMEFCRDILLALTKMTLGKEEHLASIQKEITTVLRRGENNYYKSVLDLKDEVLKIWKGSQRNAGPASKEYTEVKLLCERFDELYDRRMDNVRGLGGSADLGYLRHGAHWLGQQVKVYWPEEHTRVEGVIDDHDQVDKDTHVYHIVYQDGNEQWTVLPHKNVEILGWVPHSEERSSGMNAAMKYSGRDANKRCSLTAAKSILKPSRQTVDGRRQKIFKVPGAPTPAAAAELQVQQHSVLHDKLQAKMARQKNTRMRPPAYRENQQVEVNTESTLFRYVKGIITGVHTTGLYDVYLPESGVRESQIQEGRIRARQTTKTRFEFLPLVQELRRKVQYDFYDEPVNEELVPGYYHPEINANKWSITAWNTQSMCFLWMESKAQMQQYPNLASVERDFNSIIENAVTFNFANDIVNKEAVRLFHACKNTFGKWARKTHIYSCMKCSDEHVPDDPDMQLLLCDGCCEPIHARCFYESKNAKLLYQQEDVHPFRQDDALFCSVSCFNGYQRVSSRFQLVQARPPLRQLPLEPVDINKPYHRVQTVPQTLPIQPPPACFEHAPALQNVQPLASHQPAQMQLDGAAQSLKRHAPEEAADLNERPVNGQKRDEAKPLSQPEHLQGVKDSLTLLQAMRAAIKAQKLHYEALQRCLTQLKENLACQSGPISNLATLTEDTVKACSQLGKTISDAHANKAKFLLTTGSSTAVVNGRQEHSSSMSRKLQQLSTLVKQVLAVKTSDHVAFGLCQSTQLDLQNALQTMEDPPEELFDAAEKACEAYDGSTSHTQAIRQKFLTICSEIDTLSQSQVS